MYVSCVFQFAKLQEKVDRYETEVAELNNKCEDLQYDSETAKQKTHTLELRLAHSEEELRKRMQVLAGSLGGNSVFVARSWCLLLGYGACY